MTFRERYTIMLNTSSETKALKNYKQGIECMQAFSKCKNEGLDFQNAKNTDRKNSPYGAYTHFLGIGTRFGT